MTAFPCSKQKRDRTSHSLFLQILFQEKPFFSLDSIAVGKALSKEEVYYYFGASHSVEGRENMGNSIYCNRRLKHI